MPMHEGIIGAAASLRRPVVVPDVTLDPRYRMINPETRSELAVPMIFKNRVVGVMDLESPQLNYFTPDHVQVLSILAAHLAVSIENARLYEQVARDEARMERDLNAARRIQGASAAAIARPRIRSRYCRARRFFARAERRSLRLSSLRPAGSGHCAGRREREGKCGGALRRGRGRHAAQPRIAEAAAGEHAARHQWISGRAPDRRPLHDALLRHLESPAAPLADRQRRPGAAASFPWRTLRENSSGGISSGNFRGGRPTTSAASFSTRATLWSSIPTASATRKMPTGDFFGYAGSDQAHHRESHRAPRTASPTAFSKRPTASPAESIRPTTAPSLS